MAPELIQHTLLSARNFSGDEYILIYYENDVNIYYGRTAKIKISEAEVLKVLRLVMLEFNGIHHSLATGHR